MTNKIKDGWLRNWVIAQFSHLGQFSELESIDWRRDQVARRKDLQTKVYNKNSQVFPKGTYSHLLGVNIS